MRTAHTPRWAIKEERENEAKNPGPDINEALKRGRHEDWEEPSEKNTKRPEAEGDAQPHGDAIQEDDLSGGSDAVAVTDVAIKSDGTEAGGLDNQDGGRENGRKDTVNEDEDTTWNYDAEDQIIFESVNITSAASNREQTLKRRAKILAIQEHSVDGKEAADFKQQAKEEGWEVILGPLDPELGRKTAWGRFWKQERIDATSHQS